MPRVRLLSHRNRQVSTPRPVVTEDGNLVSNVIVFDDEGIAEVTDEQAEFLVGQFRGAEILDEDEGVKDAEARSKESA